jgi:hypothetical protein
VSFVHSRAAWEFPLPAAPKLVLLCYAHHACELCGLAWPSAKTVAARTGLGLTAVRESVDRLVKLGCLKLHAYPQGGRGRSTQYVVLPVALPDLSTPACAKCQWNIGKGPPGGGFDIDGTPKGTAR